MMPASFNASCHASFHPRQRVSQSDKGSVDGCLLSAIKELFGQFPSRPPLPLHPDQSCPLTLHCIASQPLHPVQVIPLHRITLPCIQITVVPLHCIALHHNHCVQIKVVPLQCITLPCIQKKVVPLHRIALHHNHCIRIQAVPLQCIPLHLGRSRPLALHRNHCFQSEPNNLSLTSLLWEVVFRCSRLFLVEFKPDDVESACINGVRACVLLECVYVRYWSVLGSMYRNIKKWSTNPSINPVRLTQAVNVSPRVDINQPNGLNARRVQKCKAEGALHFGVPTIIWHHQKWATEEEMGNRRRDGQQKKRWATEEEMGNRRRHGQQKKKWATEEEMGNRRRNGQQKKSTNHKP